MLEVGQKTFDASPQAALEQFECLRRLLASKVGFEAFTTMENLRGRLGKRIVIGLKSSSEGVRYAAIDMMGALLKVHCCFFHGQLKDRF